MGFTVAKRPLDYINTIFPENFSRNYPEKLYENGMIAGML
jgi:hypothetical protein